MELKPQICFRDIEETQAIRHAIEKQVRRLEHLFPRISGCRVMVESRHHHQRKGNPYHVRVDVTVPGKEIVVTPNPKPGGKEDDLYLAIKDAFGAAARRLQDCARECRGDLKGYPFRSNGGLWELASSIE
ncbi:MAG: ribosome-associated translation inhibitor RaiA [Deltaproteobacteria bacterium]|nr:ribosome-associated translation inhibitor RaiA [Deltaproteobacteria bacterium]MBI3294245.1 ribosome-associated translation inhibitor RaiA [Deltaproteobacteria bacterium]